MPAFSSVASSAAGSLRDGAAPSSAAIGSNRGIGPVVDDEHLLAAQPQLLDDAHADVVQAADHDCARASPGSRHAARPSVRSGDLTGQLACGRLVHRGIIGGVGFRAVSCIRHARMMTQSSSTGPDEHRSPGTRRSRRSAGRTAPMSGCELQREARRFAMDEVKPVADEYDPDKREMPRSLIESMGKQGYFGIMVATASTAGWVAVSSSTR